MNKILKIGFLLFSIGLLDTIIVNGQGAYFIKNWNKDQDSDKGIGKEKEFWQTFSEDEGKSLLKKAPIQIGLDGNQKRYISTELISGLMGSWKVSFGSTIVANAGDSTNNKDLQTFFNGGGMAFLQGSKPLKVSSYEKYRFHGLFFNPKILGNLPVANEVKENPDWGADLGLEYHGMIGTKKEEICLIWKSRLAVAGVSDGLKSSISKNPIFAYFQVGAGIILEKKILINIGISPMVTNRISKNPTTVGVQLDF